MAQNSTYHPESLVRALIGGLLAVHDMLAYEEDPVEVAQFAERVAVAAAQAISLTRTEDEWERLTGEAFEMLAAFGLAPGQGA